MPTWRDIYDRSQDWWRIRTKLEKSLTIIFVLLLLLIIIISIATSGSRSCGGVTVVNCTEENKFLDTSRSCKSIDCFMETSRLVRYIDPKVGACDNFFNFACGKYDQRSFEEDKQSLYLRQMDQLLKLYKEPIGNLEHKMIRTSKRFLQTCINETGLEEEEFKTIKRVLASGGGWPALYESKWVEEEFDWLKFTYKLRHMGYFYTFFFDFFPSPDPESNVYRLKIIPSDMYDYGYDAFKVDKIRHMKSIAIILGAKNYTALDEEFSKVQEFHDKFETKNRNYTNESEFSYTIRDFQEMSESINWLEYINNILGPTLQLTSNDRVLFPDPAHANKVLENIHKTPKRVIANYMMWKLVENSMPYLTREMRNTYVGYRKSETHEQFCLREIENMYNLSPIKILLQDRQTNPDKSKALDDFLQAYKTEYVKTMENFPWKNNSQKVKLVNKVKTVTVLSEATLKHSAVVLLDELDVDMDEPETSSLLDLFAQQQRNMITAKFHQITQVHSDQSFWRFERVNLLQPSFLEFDNEIVVPPVLVDAFHFSENLPNYINYGKMGTAVGNAFSDVILFFDHKNAVLEKAVADTLAKFNTQGLNMSEKELLVKQVITQQVAYKVYQDWVTKQDEEEILIEMERYTPNQLFWIASASDYCYFAYGDPGKASEFRVEPKIARIVVNASMRQNSNFIDDFKCE